LTSFVRNPKDFWAGLIYLAFGFGAAFIAREYGMGTALKMGAAYFPTVLGCLLLLIGIISLIRSFIEPGTPIGRFSLSGLFLVVVPTVIFGLLVRGAGLIVAVPVLVISSGYASVRFHWTPTLVLAAGLTLFCAVVFIEGLGVPLPILGSWFGG
jgi:putative tricarboxylic transport membrane protein